MIDEIKSIADIQKLVKSGFDDWQQYGYVTVRERDDLLIFNYNTMAVYSDRWSFFERVSRGLIINRKTGEIVARPFDKFFNWFQGGRRARGHIVSVTEKVDGSVGILYRHKGAYHISTRGSFESPQSQWATEYLNTLFDLSDLDDSLTLIFEIVYPDNRIIVDYGDREDLVLLAARNRFTGEYLPFFPDLYDLSMRYGFTLPKVHAFNDLVQILEKTGEIDEDEEGYVVEFSDGNRFKFKGDRYLELQKLITSLTFKNVLKAVQSNKIHKVLDTVPDEFLGEVRGWIDDIESTVTAIKAEVKAVYADAPKDDRKVFAEWVKENYPKLSKYLFFKFDQKDFAPLIYYTYEWKQLENKFNE